MQLLLLTSSMHTGGAERVAASLANAWSRRGYAVSLLVTYSGRGECHYALDEKVQLVYLSDLCAASVAQRGSHWAFYSAYVQRLFALRRFIREQSFSVAVSFLTNVNIIALLSTRGLGIPVLVSERVHPPQYRLGRLWEFLRAITYPWADVVVMQTDLSLQWLNATIPKAHGCVIANPVVYPLPNAAPKLVSDTAASTSLNTSTGAAANTTIDLPPKEQKILLAVGRLSAQKQFHVLLAVFANIAPRFADWQLFVLGDGPDREALISQTKALGLADRVNFLGRVSNVAPWYERADLYVMSSAFEGFPNTLLEAMAYGCAVVSVDCDTGPRDMIRNGLDGVLVDPAGGAPALANALSLLMNDEQQRRALGQRAIEVRERFAQEKILALWDEAISAAMNSTINTATSTSKNP